ncbi:dTDP-4-dehydrorhamnose reductase [Streptomyces sp. 1114.5]|uniref:dTDP-4-dehydrorhamnose reductase n=1 Tax=unclassified Streptomyces TaxID=2593676 RepID=UPI000BD01491|nr:MULTISPECIES: dTDP-4-dehydrorhamnose reductase [unclassified Streptomyces]RKT17062.1 dTDP-4-dehydrorhamnose reductase [Streptomyces sp. 1114.5]SOB83273.1 dTDP-4-dehydrorhamnose reductase [Streptomyces sp. 1331.2]
MRILLLGAEGLLGTTVRTTAEADPRVTELVALGRKDVDITSQEQVSRIVREVRPDACVNTAALMPADLCDRTPEQAYAVNVLGARWVSQACSAVGAVPVYISTDFVFDGQGDRAYRPDDLPRPVQTYGITKLAGEHETRLGSERHLITRTACLFGPPPTSGTARASFVDRVAEVARAGGDLKVVDNVVMSPTYTVDLATTILDLLHHRADSGVYHVTNEGSTSWYRLCVAALERLGIDAPVTPVEEQFFTSAPRPHHTPLTGGLPAFVRRIRRPWQDALDEYLGARDER